MKATAIAASIAFPPFFNINAPDSVASGVADETKPEVSFCAMVVLKHRILKVIKRIVFIYFSSKLIIYILKLNLY